MSRDYQCYLIAQDAMKLLRSRHGVAAIDLPEYQAAWRMAEAIKNKHGGMPPKPEDKFSCNVEKTEIDTCTESNAGLISPCNQ